MRVEPKIAVNLIVFQVGWLLCVLGGANEQPLAGTLVVVAAIMLHLALAQRSMPEALLIATVAFIGFIWDSWLVAWGLMHYPSGNLAPGFAPYWIVAIWALFATSLNLSMAWLQERPWLAALFGAIGAPLAFFAGERLGGVQMSDPALALGAQAIGWAVLLPLLTGLASRLNGFGPPAARGGSRSAPEAHSNA